MKNSGTSTLCEKWPNTEFFLAYKNTEQKNSLKKIPPKLARTKIKISDAIYNIFSVELSLCDKISVLL